MRLESELTMPLCCSCTLAQFEWQWQEKGDSALGGIGSTAATAIPRNGPDRKQRLAHILSDQAMFARTPLQITAWPYA